MELRWILVLISLLILSAILIDGWRRMKRQESDVEREQNYSAMPEQTAVAESMSASFAAEGLADASYENLALAEDDLFIVYVAPLAGNLFSGAELLPAVLPLGLRYGDMSIFHRHEQSSGNGAILFSLAAATEPGIFNLSTMESQHFKGVALFFRTNGPKNPMNALNLMLQTARRLTDALNGELLNANREPLTPADIEKHYYMRLRQRAGHA